MLFIALAIVCLVFQDDASKEDTLNIKYAISNERLYLGKSKRKIAGCVGLKSLERTVNLYHKLRFEEIKNKPSYNVFFMYYLQHLLQNLYPFDFVLAYVIFIELSILCALNVL